MANVLTSEPNMGIRPVAPDEGISFDAVINLFKRHRVLVGICAIVAAVIVVGLGLLARRSYSSEAAFVLQASKSSSGVSGIAAQFGLAIPVADAAQSPQFYVDLLHTHQLLAPVALATYSVRVGKDQVRGDLASFLHIDESRPAVKRDKVIRALGQRISAYADPKTGVVTMTVSAPHASLAQQLAVSLLDRLNVFNLDSRKSRASAERRFIEARLLEVGEQLHASENQLEQFLETNREFRLSPKLTLEQDRLAREVTMRQQVYTSLAQSYEQAKIDEVRDLAVITTINDPELPVNPDHRGLLRKGLFALIGGAAIGLVVAFWQERRERRIALA